ncbi:MAG TPA: NUDIX domain-containing protein [Anaerolineaceae bacterium]|nr:NUDIX domain-containing protein [Anaerolineaceae bacterium]
MGADAQGLNTERYTVVPRVLIFPFSADGKVLLLSGAPHKRIWAGLWNGIGGHIESGESVLTAARRELLEETGLSAEKWTFCGQVMVDVRPESGIAFFVFRAEELTGELLESSEGNLRWFQMDELTGLPLVEDLPVLLAKTAHASRGGEPFWALYQYDARGQLVMSFSA